MYQYLFLIGTVILLCILINHVIEKLPVPSLLIFLALGMCFGENGIFHIQFNNYQAAEVICSVCLIFVMFYGGFGTNFAAARPVALKAGVLSTLGVALTAGGVGLFCHTMLKLDWPESLLVGAVISSTDAASVFHILRSQNLSLKYNTSSMLELESGSNDPMSYMLTAAMIALVAGEELSVPLMMARQLLIGGGCGCLLGWISIRILKRDTVLAEHERTVLVFALAVVAYAFPSVLGGNGYLSVYFCGILLGNSSVSQKRYLVHFFDVVTNIAQMMIFFLLGLLVTPVELPRVFIPALAVMAFMTLLARPVSVTLILLPFGVRERKKGTLTARQFVSQAGVVSWAGLRGVASIVFAIMAVPVSHMLKYDLFNLVFVIVLLSISVQGTLLPWISGKLNMIDETEDVRKTFNDYQEESDISFVKVHISENHRWNHRTLQEINIPHDLLVVLIERDGKHLIPNGQTELCQGDLLVLAAKEFEDRENVRIREMTIQKNHAWNGKTLGELHLPRNMLIIMIRRQNETLIPAGGTRIQEHDELITVYPSSQAKPVE